MGKTSERRLTEQEREIVERQKEKQEKRKAKLMRCINTVFSTEDGRVVLQFLMELCGYQKTSIVGDPRTGDLFDRGTFYNEARRAIYLELRRFVRPDILKSVEFTTSLEEIFE